MISLVLHSCLLLPTGVGFAGDVDFDSLPRHSPSRERVEQLVRAINRGPTNADDVETLTAYFFQAEDFRQAAVRATVPEWTEECDRIANTLFQRKATVVEIVVWQSVCFPGHDTAARTLVIRRQERKNQFTAHGVVSDSSGRPIENAVVRGAWPAQTTTDVNGKFSFETKTDRFDRFSLTIEAEGKERYRVDQAKNDPAAEEEAAVQLGDEAAFHGVVVEETGKGVENAGVVVIVSAQGNGARVQGRSFAASTDVNGKFRIRGIAPASRSMKIDVDSPGRYFQGGENSAAFRAGTEDDPIKLEVKPSTIVEGEVVDEAGEPVPIAQVEIRQPGTLGYQVSSTSDHKGRFSLNWRQAGTWRLVADRTGRTLGSATVEFNGESIHDVRIVMPREGGYIEGTVLLPNGDLAGECHVGWSYRASALPAPGYVNGLADDRHSNHMTVTDELGRFKLGPLPPDELYQFTALIHPPRQEGRAKAKPGDADVVVRLVQEKR